MTQVSGSPEHERHFYKHNFLEQVCRAVNLLTDLVTAKRQKGPFGPSQLLQLLSRLLDGLYYPTANKSQLMTSQLAPLRLQRTCGNEMPSLKSLITQLPQ